MQTRQAHIQKQSLLKSTKTTFDIAKPPKFTKTQMSPSDVGHRMLTVSTKILTEEDIVLKLLVYGKTKQKQSAGFKKRGQ